jgi:RimJ/RimL family protein N-acetyltransferase
MSQNRCIRLRPYRQADFAFFAGLMADEQAMRHMGGVLSPEESRELFKRILRPTAETGLELWAVEMEDSGEIIGHAGLKPPESDGAREILFVLSPAFWGRGLGTEAAQLVLDYALNVARYARIIGTVDPENIRSIRVLQNIGMQLDHWREDEQGKYPVYAINRTK